MRECVRGVHVSLSSIVVVAAAADDDDFSSHELVA